MTTVSVRTATDNPHINDVDKHRGRCHRCGWTDAVAKVTRRQRALFGSDNRFRQLCDECASDLIAAADTPRVLARARSVVIHPLRRETYRSVA